MYQFKAKDSEIKPFPLCLGNISNGFTIDSMKKTGLKQFISVDYNAIKAKNILDIHRYLIKDTWYKIIFGFIKKNY